MFDQSRANKVDGVQQNKHTCEAGKLCKLAPLNRSEMPSGAPSQARNPDFPVRSSVQCMAHVNSSRTRPEFHLKHSNVVRAVFNDTRQDAVSGFEALRQRVKSPCPCHARTLLIDASTSTSNFTRLRRESATSRSYRLAQLARNERCNWREYSQAEKVGHNCR